MLVRVGLEGAREYVVTVVQPVPLTPFASVEVTGEGFAALPFRNGTAAFSNRPYLWTNMTAPLAAANLHFSQIAGNAPSGSVNITAVARTSGHLLAATHDAAIAESLTSAKWGLEGKGERCKRSDTGHCHTDPPYKPSPAIAT